MRKKSGIIFPLICAAFTLVSMRGDEAGKETQVLINTTAGDITIKLYNETPLHRDNFIKMVENHTYDSTLFHRVIRDFMIQGGDPDSKKAPPNVMLGNGTMGFTIPAEINPKLFHKKGALAAARQSDDVNPKKESSACQFYIVHGRSFSLPDLSAMEAQVNNPIKQKIFGDLINRPENAALKKRFMNNQQAQNGDSLTKLSQIIEPMVQKEFDKTPHFSYSEEQRKAYTTAGGAPHLDGSYTVYGEVVSGMEVIDKIAGVAVDAVMRPLENVRVIKMTIIK